jgi:hypothetical protein
MDESGVPHALVEDEWLTDVDGKDIHDRLRERSMSATPGQGERLWRLLSCAACRSVGPLLNDEGRNYVDVLEQIADGLISEDALGQGRPPGMHVDVVEALARARTPWHWGRVLWRTGQALGQPNMDFRVHVPIIRCIFGNSSRPIEAHPPPPAAVTELAKTCYARFPDVDESFAVMGDVLEELGELQAAAHCRKKVHVKGCHVIDWALGKRR